MPKCKDDVSSELRDEIRKILLPSAEQRNPHSWAFACSRRAEDEIMHAVERFVTARLGEKK